jgi:cytochrome c-type biogenesis protein CcmF
MNEIEYIGEQLWYGKLGHLAIILQFVAVLVSAIFFFSQGSHRLSNIEKVSFLRMGKAAFILHVVATFSIIALIFYLMYMQAYEYYYVWQHVSPDLPLKYILAAFWEGQEGSFLLWLFWHALLGLALLRLEKTYLAPVMGTLSIVQLVLSSMLLGIYIGDTRIGINPFVLLRDEVVAPIFNQADYLSQITGSGLNPLLQNYWMTIHPPTLFLGFAALTIPFCYAVAGWQTGDHKGWTKAVLPWSLFAGFFLGLGILMGGAWAYEALSFGGYWAWDPVENMSLVPWLILVAGIHTNFIANATGHSIRSTYLFYWLAFVLIIYSTFLTRSGILGDTSAHAFTEMGLEWQLVLFVIIFFIWGLTELIRKWNVIPLPSQEEKTFTREFWMYIGSLTLLFSSILITFTTSIPVYNKIFDLLGYLTGQNFAVYHRTAPTDVVGHYNKYQLWIGIFIAVFSSIAMYFNYRKNPSKEGIRKYTLNAGLIILLSLLLAWFSSSVFNAAAWQFKLLLFSGYLAILVNILLLTRRFSSDKRMVSSAVSHFGFGLLLLGILSTGLNKRFISTNRFAQEGLIDNQSEKGLGQNITLLKGTPMLMSGYEVTYTKDSISGIHREFEILFKKYAADGSFSDSFTVTPNILYDKNFSKVAASNPSTRHYLTHDIFTHIHSLPPEQVNVELAKEKEDSLQYETYEMNIGDTLFLSDGVFGILEYIGRQTTHPDYEADPADYLGSIALRFSKVEEDSSYIASPFILYENGRIVNAPHQVNPYRLKVRLEDRSFLELFQIRKEDQYEKIVVPLNEKKAYWNNYLLSLDAISAGANHPLYAPKQEDISLSAQISLIDQNTKDTLLFKPAFVIQNNQAVISYDYFDEKTGLILGIQKLDPEREELILSIARKNLNSIPVYIEVAEKSGRTDFIVLEAIVFPGINLVWAGSLLMLLGFALSIGLRYGRK